MAQTEVEVAHVSDIPPGERKTFKIKGREITVVNVEGEFYALENFCPHMAGPVGNGPIAKEEGRLVIKCPFHEWRFDLESGDALFPGKKRIVKYDVSLEKFQVNVEDEAVHVVL